MPTKELMLLQPVEGLGNEGEQVKVRAGYARNYLLPKKLAVPLTRANRKQMEALQAAREKRLAKEIDAARQTADKLAAARVALAVKTGPEGKVFGAVTPDQLLARLAEEGIRLERKQVGLHDPVKTLGKHTTRIRLHPEISVDFEFEVVSENPIEEAAPARES